MGSYGRVDEIHEGLLVIIEYGMDCASLLRKRHGLCESKSKKVVGWYYSDNGQQGWMERIVGRPYERLDGEAYPGGCGSKCTCHMPSKHHCRSKRLGIQP